MVKINTRSKIELEEKIRFFKENDMKGTRTDCVPRKVAMNARKYPADKARGRADKYTAYTSPKS